MECLKQVSPSEWQETSELRQFYDDLANKPYCTNEKGTIFIRGKKHAIKHRFIQPNHPRVIKWLVFDIDHPDALFTFIDTGLPKPQVIIKNPKNGHAHYAYRLTTPVGIGGNSSTKAERYLKAVRDALCEALGADPGYSGNLIKNPCYIKDKADPNRHQLPIWADQDDYEVNGERDEHETYLTGAKPSYTLTELADYLDLEPLYPEQTKQKPANDTNYGRNCSLFEELRHLAYRCTNKSFNAIESYLKPIAEKKNQQFDVPLPLNEVKHIIRSIARYCARMDFTASHKAFSKLQAIRGARGGQAKGRSYDKKRQQAKELYEQGLNKSEIARKLEVSRRSVINWLSYSGCENSHNQIIAPLGRVGSLVRKFPLAILQPTQLAPGGEAVCNTGLFQLVSRPTALRAAVLLGVYSLKESAVSSACGRSLSNKFPFVNFCYLLCNSLCDPPNTLT